MSLPTDLHTARSAEGSSSGWKEMTPDGNLEFHEKMKSTGNGKMCG